MLRVTVTDLVISSLSLSFFYNYLAALVLSCGTQNL